MVTRCYLCGGRTVRRFVTAENWWGDKLALVEEEQEAAQEAAVRTAQDGLRVVEAQ